MSKIATRDAYGKTLVKLGEANDKVVVLDADLSKSTKTNDFSKSFPNRFFNMGIAEQNLVGAACGFATAGKIPFVSTFAMFATGRAFEVIRNSVCYPKLNVKICATHAGITVGEDGASHESIEDISIMRAIPNMTVVVPADGIEAEQMILEAAIPLCLTREQRHSGRPLIPMRCLTRAGPCVTAGALCRSTISISY